MVIFMADIVDDFLARMQQHIPQAPIELRATLERDLRTAWGGSKPYVAKQLAELKRVSPEDIGRVTSHNFEQLFSVPALA